MVVARPHLTQGTHGSDANGVVFFGVDDPTDQNWECGARIEAQVGERFGGGSTDDDGTMLQSIHELWHR